MIIYTDGSCSPNPGKGGWAYIAIFNDYEVHVSGKEQYTTNNLMEMSAVIEALKEFKEHTQFKIYSDSQYVINCATGKWKRNKNMELWQEYDKYANGKRIEFVWVKGHNGDYYNEMVDKLARYG